MKNNFICMAAVTCLLMSCSGTECKVSSPVFVQYSPYDKEYRAELVRQLSRINPGDLDYNIARYMEDSTGQYLEVSIKGEGLCVTGILDITGSEKLSHVIEVKGRGYCGAGLSGLKYRIDSSSGEFRLVIKSLRWIID